MKHIIALAIVFLLIGCGAAKNRQTNAEPPAGPKGVQGTVVTNAEKPESVSPASTKTMKPVSFTDDTRVGGIMNFLASDALKGRDSGGEGIEQAAQFIETIFKQNNIKPYFSSYRDTLSNFGKAAYNMVGILEGTNPVLKNEFIVIGAHYDHIGIIQAVNGDAIANGANDNASGTTVVLELARYFGNSGGTARSLMFALFSAEEKGLLGSKHLANKLKEGGMDLYAMLNFEMTGVPMKGKDYLLYVTGYENSNLAEISNKYANENLIGFLPTAKEFNLFQRSDNYPFHQAFNVPSQTFCSFDFTNFNHYHTVNDEVSEMDFKHLSKVVNKMIPVVDGIANSAVKELKYH